MSRRAKAKTKAKAQAVAKAEAEVATVCRYGSPKVRLVWAGLLAVALALSAYLGWAALRGGGVAGCGPESGCDRVLQSRWSTWFGIPVSLPALGLYALALGTTFRLKPRTTPAQQRWAWGVLVLCAVAVLGAVLWFVVLQAAVLRAFCPYCMAAHGAGALAAVLILTQAPFRAPQGKAWKIDQEVFVRPATAWRLVWASAGALALLVTGQLIYQPKTFRVSALDPARLQPTPTNATATAPTQPAARPTEAIVAPPTAREAEPRAVPTPSQPAVRHALSVHGGAIQLDLDEVPLLGSPSAPVVLISLRDYTCHHCRIMHGLLRQVYQTLSNQIAIVSLPVPLNSNCNAVVRWNHPDHTDACEYARLSLALWRTNRETLERFDEWILKPEHPPPPAQARAFAEQLVGTNALTQALRDPWVERQLQQGIGIYATNALHYRQTRMPQTIVGTNVVVGMVRGLQDLYAVLAKQPGIQWPADLRTPGQ